MYQQAYLLLQVSGNITFVMRNPFSTSDQIGDHDLRVPEELKRLARVADRLIRNVMTPEIERIIDDCGQAIEDRPDEFSAEWLEYYSAVISQMEYIYCQRRADALMLGASSRKVSLERLQRLCK